jgi:U4/U6 small nuclear ribonucleoprotein PRP31
MDNILKDLDDLEYEEDEEDEEDKAAADYLATENVIEESNEFDGKDIIKVVSAKISSNIGHFRKSYRYQNHLLTIKSSLADSNESQNTISSLQTDIGYNLVLDCNRFIHEIDDEISETHRFVVETYAKKFPELESLIPNTIDYIKTVQRIGNETDMTLVELNDILLSASVMVVSVTGSSTSGKELTQKDLTLCLKGCDEVLSLYHDKLFILQFVESRMSRIAPNLCALIGSRVCAQLVGLVGGVVALSKVPACNVEVIGQEKRHLAGNYTF